MGDVMDALNALGGWLGGSPVDAQIAISGGTGPGGYGPAGQWTGQTGISQQAKSSLQQHFEKYGYEYPPKQQIFNAPAQQQQQQQTDRPLANSIWDAIRQIGQNIPAVQQQATVPEIQQKREDVYAGVPPAQQQMNNALSQTPAIQNQMYTPPQGSIDYEKIRAILESAGQLPQVEGSVYQPQSQMTDWLNQVLQRQAPQTQQPQYSTFMGGQPWGDFVSILQNLLSGGGGNWWQR